MHTFCERKMRCQSQAALREGNNRGICWGNRDFFTRVRALCTKADIGSGTMLGAMLIMVVATCCIGLASVCQAVILHAHVRSLTDVVAVNAAEYYLLHYESPCDFAQTVAATNQLDLISCDMVDRDVIIQVRSHTKILKIFPVSSASRAGPQQCDT